MPNTLKQIKALIIFVSIIIITIFIYSNFNFITTNENGININISILDIEPVYIILLFVSILLFIIFIYRPYWKAKQKSKELQCRLHQDDWNGYWCNEIDPKEKTLKSKVAKIKNKFY